MRDQAGNVWEWCRDLLDAQAYAKQVEKEGEPVDPVEEEMEREAVVRVLRGGGRFGSAGLLRAACRNGESAGNRSVDVGFRVAAVP